MTDKATGRWSGPNCIACGDPGVNRHCCEDRPTFCDACYFTRHLPRAHSGISREQVADEGHDEAASLAFAHRLREDIDILAASIRGLARRVSKLEQCDAPRLADHVSEELKRPELPPGFIDYLDQCIWYSNDTGYWYGNPTQEGAREHAVAMAWKAEHESEHPDPWVAWADHETARADAAEAEVARLKSFRPSSVWLNRNSVSPLAGTFGKVEAEVVAGVMLIALVANGDEWGPVDWTSFRDVPPRWLGNPFLRFDVGVQALIDKDVVQREGDAIAFTADGIKTLRDSQWSAFGDYARLVEAKAEIARLREQLAELQPRGEATETETP